MEYKKKSFHKSILETKCSGGQPNINTVTEIPHYPPAVLKRYTIPFVCGTMSMHMHTHSCGGQRTTCKGQWLPPPRRAWGLNSGCQAWGKWLYVPSHEEGPRPSYIKVVCFLTTAPPHLPISRWKWWMREWTIALQSLYPAGLGRGISGIQGQVRHGKTLSQIISK